MFENFSNEIMDVIWMRLHYGKEHWLPAFYALCILKSMILHGTLSTVAEVSSGLEKIRQLTTYDSANEINSKQIRELAQAIYDVTVDRSKLFLLRRVYVEMKRLMTRQDMKEREITTYSSR